MYNHSVCANMAKVGSKERKADMKCSPFFSVIVPVYRAENFLKSSMQTVLDQGFKDFEIILVNDCSPDNSAAVCDDMAAADSRIKVIHSSENHGPGESRNIGLNAACGQYVFYMDSDDTMVLNALEKLHAIAEGEDIIAFGANVVHVNEAGETVSQSEMNSCEFYADSKDKICTAFLRLSEARSFQYIWNKIYRREFLKATNVSFEDMRLSEDFFFNIQLFGKAQSVRCVRDKFYNYIKPTFQTLTTTYSPVFFQLAKRKFLAEKEFLVQSGYETQEHLSVVYCNHMKHIVSAFIRNQSKKAKLSRKEKREYVAATLRDDTVQELFACYKPQGLQNKAVLAVLKTKNITLCLLVARFISALQKNVR